MRNCPCCNACLDLEYPRVDEVWLCAEDGVLYRITQPYSNHDGGYYGTAERLWPATLGHEWRCELAVWPDHVRQRKWVRVVTPLREAADAQSAGDRVTNEKGKGG